MKKVLFLFALLMSCTFAQAQQPQVGPIRIVFTCEGFHNGSVGHTPPKSPVDPPTVYQEDYTLSFASVHPAYALYIKDEYDNVVYSTMVGDTDTTVVLPSTLSGTYEIYLVTDDYYFWGYIAL